MITLKVHGAGPSTITVGWQSFGCLVVTVASSKNGILTQGYVEMGFMKKFMDQIKRNWNL